MGNTDLVFEQLNDFYLNPNFNYKMHANTSITIIIIFDMVHIYINTSKSVFIHCLVKAQHQNSPCLRYSKFGKMFSKTISSGNFYRKMKTKQNKITFFLFFSLLRFCCVFMVHHQNM